MTGRYIIVVIILLVFASSAVMAADVSIDPNNAWNNIKGFFMSIWQKGLDIWKIDVKPWLNKMWLEFKSFFDRERIEKEMKKEVSEMKNNLAGAGSFILSKIKR